MAERKGPTLAAGRNALAGRIKFGSACNTT